MAKGFFEGGVVTRFLVVEKIRSMEFIFFLVMFFYFWIDYNDASNRLVFALIPKLM